MNRSIATPCSSVALALALCAAGCEHGWGRELPLAPDASSATTQQQPSSALEPPGGGDGADRGDPSDPRRVAHGAPIGDAALVAELRDKLNASAAAEGRAIHVRASDGVVTLTGRVSSESARRRAQELVREVDGVQQVDNRIAVALATMSGDTRVQ